MNQNIVLGILLTSISIMACCPSLYPILYHSAYAHNFSINDDSTLLTLIEQIKTETKLVNEYFLTNNITSSIEHAKNAANLSSALNDKLRQIRIVDITQAYTNGLYNSTTLALVTANLVDEILRNYGSAYGIGYDLTNMSNMMLSTMSNNDSFSSPINLTDGHNSTLLPDRKHDSISEKNNAVLVNIHDYQTAQALSDKVNRLFSDKLLAQAPVGKKVIIDSLEQSIRDLKYAVDNRLRAEALMEIVHMKIHPMLQSVYELRLVEDKFSYVS